MKFNDSGITPIKLASLAAADTSEAQLFSAQTFLEAVYGEPAGDRGRNSRAPTPMSPSRAHTPLTVRDFCSLDSPHESPTMHPYAPGSGLLRPFMYPRSPRRADPFPSLDGQARRGFESQSIEHFGQKSPDAFNPIPFTRPSTRETRFAKSRLYDFKEPTPALVFPRRQPRERSAATPRLPDVSHLAVDLNVNSDYVVLVSMYEVYNDRIYDLLSPSIVPGQGNNMSRGNNQKDRRRPLLFKSTEGTPDRKVVAGLRKIACSTYDEALAILDVGLTERKVTGTGSNSVSSRSHGFFCLEVKKLTHSKRYGEANWVGNTLTVVDLAGKSLFQKIRVQVLIFSGSERARAAKTAGATLAEAGKINESLMYLGQCLQMQSNLQDGAKVGSLSGYELDSNC